MYIQFEKNINTCMEIQHKNHNVQDVNNMNENDF